jgi:hypothetical protein
MSAQGSTTSSPLPEARGSEASRLYQQGIVAGLLGAATIAVWFLIVDLYYGRPFYTPTVLGAALFKAGAGLASPESLQASSELVLMFTWIHGLVFMIIGAAASRMLGLAEQNPNVGFGILLFFVIFMYGFLVIAMLFAEPVLQALSWSAILIGNLLAAVAMGAYFRRCHPDLKILP